MDQHVLASELVDICVTVTTVFNQWAQAIAAQQKRNPLASALHVCGLADTAKRWELDPTEFEQSLEETQQLVQRYADLVSASDETRKCVDDIRSTGLSIASAVDEIQAALHAHPDEWLTSDESLILDARVASLDELLSYRALPLLKRVKWLTRPTGMISVESAIAGSKSCPVTQPSESGRKRVADVFKRLWVEVDAEIGAARDKVRSRGDIELDETLANLRELSMHIREYAELIHALRTAPAGGKERIHWESSHLPMFGGETPSGRNFPGLIPWQDTAAWMLSGVFRELLNATHLFDELMSDAVSDALVNPHREHPPAFGPVTARIWSIVLRETAWQHLNILSSNRVSGRGTFPEPKSPQAILLHSKREDFSVAGFEAINAAFDEFEVFRFVEPSVKAVVRAENADTPDPAIPGNSEFSAEALFEDALARIQNWLRYANLESARRHVVEMLPMELHDTGETLAEAAHNAGICAWLDSVFARDSPLESKADLVRWIVLHHFALDYVQTRNPVGESACPNHELIQLAGPLFSGIQTAQHSVWVDRVSAFPLRGADTPAQRLAMLHSYRNAGTPWRSQFHYRAFLECVSRMVTRAGFSLPDLDEKSRDRILITPSARFHLDEILEANLTADDLQNSQIQSVLVSRAVAQQRNVNDPMSLLRSASFRLHLSGEWRNDPAEGWPLTEQGRGDFLARQMTRELYQKDESFRGNIDELEQLEAETESCPDEATEVEQRFAELGVQLPEDPSERAWHIGRIIQKDFGDCTSWDELEKEALAWFDRQLIQKQIETTQNDGETSSNLPGDEFRAEASKQQRELFRWLRRTGRVSIDRLHREFPEWKTDSVQIANVQKALRGLRDKLDTYGEGWRLEKSRGESAEVWLVPPQDFSVEKLKTN